MKIAITGIIARPKAATTNVTTRQPWASTRAASSGRKMSCPVALLAVRIPMARPRRAVNQRLTTVAPSASAIMPVPAPTTRPQSNMSCHALCMSAVSATPVATRRIAPIIVRRAPRYSTSAAEKGPMSPKSTRFRDTASEMVARLQPKCCSSGTMSTPGVARVAPATSRVAKVTPSTIQA